MGLTSFGQKRQFYDVQFPCHYCSQVVEAPNEDAGKEAPCPFCRAVIMVPFQPMRHVEAQRLEVLSPEEPRTVADWAAEGVWLAGKGGIKVASIVIPFLGKVGWKVGKKAYHVAEDSTAGKVVGGWVKEYQETPAPPPRPFVSGLRGIWLVGRLFNLW